MTFPDALTTAKPRLLLALSTALAALMVALMATAGTAAASSGGTTPPGGSGSSNGGGGGGSAQEPTVNEAKYARIWKKVAAANKRWAKSTSDCESGGNPRAIGGGGQYRGAFQFTKSTWRASPKSPGGDPITFSFRTQAVVAVLLKQREGTDPWPVCG